MTPSDRWPDRPQDQQLALAQLDASIESFKDAFAGVLAAGIRPTDALEACGYDVPLMARPMVNTLLAVS